jgi:uncharacterized membrane protein
MEPAMRGLLLRMSLGIAALLIFHWILGGLYRFALPEWYEDTVLFGEHRSSIFAALLVTVAQLAAGAVLLIPTWRARQRTTPA